MPAPTAHSPDDRIIPAATGDSAARCPHSNARFGSEVEWNLRCLRNQIDMNAMQAIESPVSVPCDGSYR